MSDSFEVCVTNSTVFVVELWSVSQTSPVWQLNSISVAGALSKSIVNGEVATLVQFTTRISVSLVGLFLTCNFLGRYAFSALW